MIPWPRNLPWRVAKRQTDQPRHAVCLTESTMNYRLMFLTSGLLAGTALGTGCNSREELAPWFPQELQIVCTNAPEATVGQAFRWDLKPTGGMGAMTWEATGLPPGLMIDDNGVISGTPTTEGQFADLVITVTDEDGNVRVFESCGKIVVGLPNAPTIECIDATGSIPDGFVGLVYTDFTIKAPGGVPPYTWEVTGLPPGLTFTPAPDGGVTGVVSGIPTAKGTFKVEVRITDKSGTQTIQQCGDLVISDPISVDPGELLGAYPDGCVPLGVSLAQLQSDGILFGGDGTPITCELRAGRGNGSGDFDNDVATPDTLPPGLALDGACAVTGTVSPSLPFGIYGFITTFSQSGQNAYVPYCAPQMSQPPKAYDIFREDTGSPATFKPGHITVGAGESISYGTDVPDPKVTVTDDVGACVGNNCFYTFVFTYNTLSSMAKVNANPNKKFPDAGFDGFTHAVKITDGPLDSIFRGRAYVANVRFDYCIADNDQDCGNAKSFSSMQRSELVRQNGGGSSYYFSLVVLPK